MKFLSGNENSQHKSKFILTHNLQAMDTSCIVPQQQFGHSVERPVPLECLAHFYTTDPPHYKVSQDAIIRLKELRVLTFKKYPERPGTSISSTKPLKKIYNQV